MANFAKKPMYNPENNFSADELPTRRRTVNLDETVQKSFRWFARSTGLTNHLALHALLNCFDAYGDQDSADRYIASYKPGPTKITAIAAADITFASSRGLAFELRTTANVTLAVLLLCFQEHAGLIRVEGAGLRVPCSIDAPCAPDAPSTGPMAIRHISPSRLGTGISACVQAPALKVPVPDGAGGEKAALLRAQADIAYRWFLGYTLNEELPHFSTVSYNFRHRFTEETIEQVFQWVLNEAGTAGALSPEAVFIDGTHIKAGANLNRKIKRKCRRRQSGTGRSWWRRSTRTGRPMGRSPSMMRTIHPSLPGRSGTTPQKGSWRGGRRQASEP